MTLTEKVRAWIDSEGYTQDQAEIAAKVPQSQISKMLSDGRTNSLKYVMAIQKAIAEKHPGATLDWLVSPDTSWPPPVVDTRARLTVGEARLLEVVRLLWPDDPELTTALRRLRAEPGDTYPGSRTAADDQAEREAAKRGRPRNRPGSGTAS